MHTCVQWYLAHERCVSRIGVWACVTILLLEVLKHV